MEIIRDARLGVTGPSRRIEVPAPEPLPLSPEPAADPAIREVEPEPNREREAVPE
jgi:hypothetical protein